MVGNVSVLVSSFPSATVDGGYDGSYTRRMARSYGSKWDALREHVRPGVKVLDFGCGEPVTHPTHKLSVCPEHGVMDRDINAAANIAARAVPRVAKARATRAKNRKLRPQAPLKTPPARASLKYPGRDRTKGKPTPKRKNHRRTAREVILPVRPARAQAYSLEASVLADQGACVALGTNEAALKRGNMAYKCRLCGLI